MTTLADIIGPQAAAADPGAVRALARRYNDTAQQAQQAAQRLQALNAAGWQGEASGRFAAKRDGDLPPRLAKLATTYDHGSGTLQSYASELEAVQHEGRALARQRDAALDAVRVARQRAATAGAALARAHVIKRGAVDPVAAAAAARDVVRAQGAATRAGAAVVNAGAELARTEAAAAMLRARLDGAGSRAGGQLAQASGGDPSKYASAAAVLGAAVGAVVGAARQARDAVGGALDVGKAIEKYGSFPGRLRDQFSDGVKGAMQQAGRRDREFRRWFNRHENAIRTSVTKHAANAIKTTGRFGRGAAGFAKTVGKKLPAIGIALAAWDVGYELVKGNVAKAVAVGAIAAAGIALGALGVVAIGAAAPVVAVAGVVAIGAVAVWTVADLATGGGVTKAAVDGLYGPLASVLPTGR